MQAVVLDDGEALPADLVVVGLGIKPATEILQGVELNADGSVSTDRRLQVTEGLYAAGDVARFPDWRDGDAIRIEHWRLAEQHGRVAAHNMAGRRVEFVEVPFFWASSLISSSSMSGTRRPGMNLSSTVTWRDAIFWPSMSRTTG